MGEWFDWARKLLEFQLPSLPTYIKVLLTLILTAIVLLLVISMWRDPRSLESLDPATHERLNKGIVQFFKYYQGLADPPSVFGEAKDIVRRMKSEPDVFARTDEKIESLKRSDVNWYHANKLASGKALVNTLGLTPETKRENEVLLQIPLPNLNSPTP